MAKIFKRKELKPEPAYLAGKKVPEPVKVVVSSPSQKQSKLDMFRTERK
tara:strand:- start:21856 stop:22002 length:147 start_codon:yes stop_codon:yes gene_type:complete